MSATTIEPVGVSEGRATRAMPAVVLLLLACMEGLWWVGAGASAARPAGIKASQAAPLPPVASGYPWPQGAPTQLPTAYPTAAPTAGPVDPTAVPTVYPTAQPQQQPTQAPSDSGGQGVSEGTADAACDAIDCGCELADCASDCNGADCSGCDVGDCGGCDCGGLDCGGLDCSCAQAKGHGKAPCQAGGRGRSASALWLAVPVLLLAAWRRAPRRQGEGQQAGS